MTKKGLVTEVDNTNKTAKVLFQELDGTVSAELKTLSGCPDLEIKDTVAVLFFSPGYSDGVILGKIGV